MSDFLKWRDAEAEDSLVPVYEKMGGMIYVLKDGPMKGSDLFKIVSYSYAPKNIERSLKILRESKLVEMTIKEEPNSSKQQYRLTVKGVELLSKFTGGLKK
jgi:DNA-binding PadR family transcriptional regulator